MVCNSFFNLPLNKFNYNSPKKENVMFGMFGKSENEAEICQDINKKIIETQEAFRVSRNIYDTFGLPDGDYYVALKTFGDFVEMWDISNYTIRHSKLQLKLVRSQLNLLHKGRMVIVSNLIEKYGRPNELNS
jgi:hypothetical protein